MANLNERQQRLLDAVRETNEQVAPVLQELEDDYQFALYQAKAPVREAILAAEDAGVPFSRIMKDGVGFTYPGKLRAWIQAPEAVVKRIMGSKLGAEPTTEFDTTVRKVGAVVRDPSTGEFSVSYLGDTYKVPSYGPAQECWSSADPEVPQGAYDLIQREYPSWVLLEDEED